MSLRPIPFKIRAFCPRNSVKPWLNGWKKSWQVPVALIGWYIALHVMVGEPLTFILAVIAKDQRWLLSEVRMVTYSEATQNNIGKVSFYKPSWGGMGNHRFGWLDFKASKNHIMSTSTLLRLDFCFLLFVFFFFASLDRGRVMIWFKISNLTSFWRYHVMLNLLTVPNSSFSPNSPTPPPPPFIKHL